MVGAVQGGPDQGIHARSDADITHVTLALDLRHTRQQHACTRDEKTTWFNPEFVPGIRGLDLGECVVHSRQIKGFVARFLGYAQAAAQIDRLDGRKALGYFDQLRRNRAPGIGIRNSAAAVCVNTDHLSTGGIDEFDQLIDLESWHPKLGMNTRGLHVFVVASSLTGIETHEQFLSLEQFRPLLQGMKIIERNLQTTIDGPCIFLTRREVWRKQDSIKIEVREYFLKPLDFAGRNTFEIYALFFKFPQQIGVEVAFIA